MLTIRLARTGRKKAPSYRFVISEKARDTFGRSLEILGHYHPQQNNDKDKLIINKERIEYWISKGAGTSDTVHNLLIEAGVIKGDKKRTIGKYKSKKAEDKKEEVKSAPESSSENSEEKKEASTSEDSTTENSKDKSTNGEETSADESK